MEFLYLLFIVSVPLSTKCNEPDPCSDTVYRTIRDLPKRSPSFFMNSVPLCDYHLYPGWYGAEHYKIPTSPPSLGTCGTLYPFWLKIKNGKHPQAGTIADAVLCKMGFRDNCTLQISIKVKNCTTFIIYQLQPVPLCNSAYCFELNEYCVSESPSDLLVSYHNVSWEEDIQGITTSYSPSVNLKCSFTPLADTSLFYEILWYVDHLMVKTQTLPYDSLENALLSSEDITNKMKKAGSTIYCLVGAKSKKNGFACVTESSESFFAGIRVLTPRINIKRGESAVIQLQLTIPYADQSFKINGKYIAMPCLLVSLATVHGNLDSCKSANDNANHCDLKIKSFSHEEREKYATDEWREIYNMTIFNKDNLDFKDANKKVTLRLRTGGTHTKRNKLFHKIILQDIQVFITESNSAWKGKHCQSHVDPHMRTFDGLRYECHENGKYILYRNTKFNQEVQVKHHQCHPSYPSPRCVCAVAARSGQEIFTVNLCEGITLINFPLCDDKAFKVLKWKDKNYKVLFPTGTSVEILIVGWPSNTDFQINVNIYPSPADVDQTSGLCGILDGNQQNDLRKRNDDHNNFRRRSTRDFYISWQVPTNEDLFKDENMVAEKFVSISNTLTKACTCKVFKEDVKECDIQRKKSQIECTYGTVGDCKYKGQEFPCKVFYESKRRKRDLSHLKNIMKSIVTDAKEINHLERSKRQVYDVRTRTEAQDVCIKAFKESEAYTTCRQYISALSTTAVENCILDVMMTGDNNITRIHIEAALVQCSNLVQFNSTFQEEQPEITHIVESLCPNNCSGNGACNEGNCTCHVNFAGSDCSFDVLGPPNIRHISDFGLCDKSYEECDEITLYGELFLEQMNTECYMTRKTIQQDGILLSQTFLQSSLEPRTLFEGYCPLSYSNESHWVTEFTFNMSNDGVRFTDNFHVYSYQSDCQEFKNTSGSISFTLKTGYCFINGRCYIDGGTNRDNQCDLCNVTLDRYSWSFNPGHCLINGECYINGAIEGINPCSACLSSVDRWNWSNNPGYCYIDDICYFEGQSKKNNDCYKCNYTLDRTGWTFNEGHCLIDGQCFKAGESHQINRCMMCDPNYNRNNWTISSAYCFVNGSCLQNGESEKRNPCVMCNISNSKYSLSPNPAYCDIDGLCVAHGLNNDDKSCLHCNTSINRGSWSLTPGFCFVNDSCIVDGESDKIKQCFMCNASASTHSLSPNPAFCYIGGLCVANGQENDTKSCFYCNTTINKESWSLHLDFCVIDGNCIEHGNSEENNDCKVCDAYSNHSVWQIKDGHCYIQERCFKDSEVNSTYPCQICNSSNEVFNFSSNLAYCNIDDLCVADGQKHDAKSCLYCNTSLSRENWSFNQDYCMINGSCIKHGSTEQNKDCRVCDAYTNYSVWQLKDGHCYIQETCFKDSDVNSTSPCQMCNSSNEVFQFSTNLAYCNIENLCVADGEKHDAKSCLYCNTSLSRESWSFNQDYCMINGNCIKHGSTETNKDCRVCDTFTNHNVWQIKDEHCYIQETCFKDLEVNVTFPCQLCNPSNDVYEFSSNPAYCNIDDFCVADGQKHDAKSCFYCNTSLSRDNWSFNQDYCMINGSCIKHGSTEPNKDCRVCDTFTNYSVWQIKDEHCYIQETCFKDLEVNVTFPCQICNSSNDVYEFSSNPAYCNIGGLCVDDEQKNDAKSCLYCNTSFSRENWSFNQDYCMINGSCIKHGSIEPNKDCRVCDTFTNYSVWQIKDEHCYIQESCFKDLEVNLTFPCQICNSSNDVYEFSSNPAYCNIGGLCVADRQENNIKTCLICNTSLSRGNWSLGSDYCMINGNCVDNGKTEQGKECRVCDSFTNSSVWKIKDGYCYIQENCFKDFEINLEFPCQFCNSSNEMYGFSPNTECLSSAAEKTTNGSPFSNPIFIGTVSLIGAIGVITILISIIYRFKTKLTKEWSIANEVSEGTTDGNVGLTVYKRINTED